MYEIEFTDDAIQDLQYLRKHEQRTVLDAIEQQLIHEPLTDSRNRKPLRPNDLSQWELRVDRFRVFYDVASQNAAVVVKGIGWKEHNKLFIHGREFQL
jgi:mRNA-degrading endonuclease RelE of RelBE toxin-antitoxin system